MDQLKSELLLIVILFLIGCQQPNLVEVADEEYQEMIARGELPDLGEIVIKDEHGNVISLDSLQTLHREGDYYDRFYQNNKGEIVAYQLVKKPALQDLSIDCSQIERILDSVLIIDQSIRTEFNPQQDYANLEIVTNVIEKCGMPQSSKLIKTVFLVVQHNHSNYQKKYISSFREAADAGSLSKSTLALMEDRILMNEGQPQMYGTQVRRDKNADKWELYELMEPAKVDQRRASMHLGPLKEYLENFDIAFTIEQVEE